MTTDADSEIVTIGWKRISFSEVEVEFLRAMMASRDEVFEFFGGRFREGENVVGRSEVPLDNIGTKIARTER